MKQLKENIWQHIEKTIGVKQRNGEANSEVDSLQSFRSRNAINGINGINGVNGVNDSNSMKEMPDNSEEHNDNLNKTNFQDVFHHVSNRNTFSLQSCLVCLLHLANEKGFLFYFYFLSFLGLELYHDQEDQNDFWIKDPCFV